MSERRETETEFLMRVLRGHSDAVRYCQVLFFVSQAWDDLVDNRDSVTTETINQAFRAALTVIPANPFFLEHAVRLTVLQDAAIVDWLDANTLAGTDELGTHIAYVLRESVYSIVRHCAEIVGGSEWAQQVAPEIRRHIFNEPYEVYRQEYCQ